MFTPTHEQLAYFLTRDNDSDAEVAARHVTKEVYVPGSALADLMRRQDKSLKNLPDEQVLYGRHKL